MDATLLATRLLLTLIFGTAGLAKLADRGGSRQALIDFGVAGALATPLGVLQPLAEPIVAVALLFPSMAWCGSLGALACLLLFVAGIGLNLAQGAGRTAAASASSTPRRSTVDAGTQRALAAVAGFVVWQGRDNPGPSVVGWLGGPDDYRVGWPPRRGRRARPAGLHTLAHGPNACTAGPAAAAP
jgi:uncharacterized membrane protein YphA (DoxX/SURF4 family)